MLGLNTSRERYFRSHGRSLYMSITARADITDTTMENMRAATTENLSTLGTGSALKLSYCPDNEIPLRHSQISDNDSESHKAILTFRNLL